ncbi:lytic transglycosylase domain-containing protein [Roseicitreum antarcticum]|uniref:Transglycosylase SLT domain-containing protein n=1 Tax=Roseicitreum antarcticum TaxID=564137 RepID=A0A1H2R3T2_9RHOB|nr:lytic transglycosylase domain-containing protein [Roseicitreum antarcticum]SDW14047.1 Transglycosylase SLT domain-containing protein [Roseicitreum antarcticum]
MPALPRRAVMLMTLAALAGCGSGRGGTADSSRAGLYPNETPQLRRQIEYWANFYDVPVDLVHRVVIRESRHRPQARNGPYWGLMQILPQTARTMGHRGPPSDLLDPNINLQYAVKYLRGAWLVADGDRDRAVMWYARGYYYEARDRGMLRETGLRS